MGKKGASSTKNGTILSGSENLRFRAVHFYRAASGREPVREWLKQLDRVSRKRIGGDLYTLQLGWPVGMPLARKIERGLWELRSPISDGIARIMFTEKERKLILLHGFIKKSQKTAARELAVARRRLRNLNTGK
ncbi:MAG: type II toxin-antitoxin system RelE/ParE family toxin [Lysobacterales bacterium]